MTDTEQLVERTLQGDSQAQAALYGRFRAQAVRACRGIVGSHSLAEELADDAFLVAFAKLHQLEDPAKFGSWLCRIARRLALRHRQRSHDLPLAPLDEVADLPDEEPQLPSEGEIMSAVDSLPQGYREVFRLSILEGKTHLEIADQLGIQPHSSSSQLARAKRMLRTMLRFGWLLLVLPLAWLLLHREPRETPRVAQADRPAPVPGTTEAFAPKRTLTPAAVEPDEAAVEEPHIPIADSTPHTVSPSASPPPEPVPLPVPDFRVEPAAPARWAFAMTYSLPTGPSNTGTQPGSLSLANAGTVSNWGEVLEMPTEQSGTSALNKIITEIASSNLDNNGGRIVRTERHQPPVELALSATYRLGDRLSLGTGLGMMRLESSFTVGEGPDRIEQSQRIDYLNVPAGIQYRLLQVHGLSLYASASATLHLPVNAVLTSDYLIGGESELSESSRQPGHAVFSVGVGMGLQWSITPRLSLFAEPTLRRYSTSASAQTTYLSQHPYTFSIPCGLRIAF